MVVLATGFGMNNIPGMEPLVRAEEEEQKKITREEQERLAKEEQEINEMLDTYYKPSYKIHIFSDEEMYNEEFITAIDNSPTYKRTAQELEKIVAIMEQETVTGIVATAEETTTVVATVEESEEQESNQAKELI